MRVSVKIGSGPSDFIATLKKFAADEHLVFQEVTFSRQGRKVYSGSIHLNEGTFFQAQNSHDPTKFELFAYSHEAKEVWEPIWNKLINEITRGFGEKNTERGTSFQWTTDDPDESRDRPGR